MLTTKQQNRGVDHAAPEDPTAGHAIERALAIYEQFKGRDRASLVQARKAVTVHIYGMVAGGETDEQRLTVGGLTELKRRERDGSASFAGGSR